MAQPRRKGKSKQKNKKPPVVVETEAKKVDESTNVKPEEKVQTTVVPETKPEEPAKPMSKREQKKALKAQAKKDKRIAKEKAKKKQKEADEKAGKIGLKQRFKETGSELKKISWPSFKETMKKTGVVIAVVLFFSVVLVAFDFGLSKLFGLLM